MKRLQQLNKQAEIQFIAMSQQINDTNPVVTANAKSFSNSRQFQRSMRSRKHRLMYKTVYARITTLSLPSLAAARRRKMPFDATWHGYLC